MEVSVIIPVFNCKTYLQQAIQSALNQEYVAEIIVADDGSTDQSLAVAMKMTKEYNRVKLITHPNRVHLGISATRNLAIRHSNSAFIAFLDSDDLYHPNRFLGQSELFQNSIDGVYSDIETLYEAPSMIDLFPERYTGVPNDVNPDRLFDFLVQNDAFRISLNGLIIRKSVFNEVGLFDEKLKLGEDTDFVWRLSMECTLIKRPDDGPVAVRRIHGSNTSLDTKEVALGRFEFYKKWLHFKEGQISRRSRRVILKKYLYYLPAARRLDRWKLSAHALRFVAFLAYHLRIDIR